MELAGMKKFLNAVETAEIKEWCAQVDNYNLYHNNRGYNYFDEASQQVVNISKNTEGEFYAGNKNPYMIRTANLADIHELRITCDIDQVKAFISAYGIELTEDLEKILVKIKAVNSPIKPPSGDYTFRILSEIGRASCRERVSFGV